MRTAVAFALCVGILFGAFAGLAQAGEAAKPITLKLAHEGPMNDQRQKASETFARLIKEKTGGRAVVEVYGASSLGPKEQVMLGMETGTVDSLIEDVGTLQRYSNYCALGFMPFMYTGEAHYRKLWKTAFKDEYFGEVEKKSGFKLMGIMYRGGRQITSSANRPIAKLEDLKGLKIRVPTSEVMIAGFKALGASPTPMAFPEVFGALQQKVIDAQENPLDTINSNSLQEVAPNITLSSHIISSYNFMFFAKTFQKYPDWLQKAIVESAEAAGDEYSNDTSKKEQDILAKFKANPKVKIITLSSEELGRWQKAVAAVHGTYPELVPVIKKVIDFK